MVGVIVIFLCKVGCADQNMLRNKRNKRIHSSTLQESKYSFTQTFLTFPCDLQHKMIANPTNAEMPIDTLGEWGRKLNQHTRNISYSFCRALSFSLPPPPPPLSLSFTHSLTHLPTHSLTLSHSPSPCHFFKEIEWDNPKNVASISYPILQEEARAKLRLAATMAVLNTRLRRHSTLISDAGSEPGFPINQLNLTEKTNLHT